jgi:uncharacterized protein (TIGR00369 family)
MPISPRELIQQLNAMIPFHGFLGLQLVDAREGQVRLLVPYRDEIVGDPTRPALHGGVLSTLVDACGGFAVWTQLAGADDRVSTIDLRVDYLAPAGPEALVAEGRVVRVGNRVGVVDVRVWQPSDEAHTVATGKAVYNIKRKEDAP